MKDIIKIISGLAAGIVLLTNCSDMNDSHDEYLRNGEIVYIGRIDSAYVYAGTGRFLLHYYLTDPRAKKLRITWSQGADSMVVPIATHEPSEMQEVMVGDASKEIEEGAYTLQIYSSDGADLRSVKYETNVNVYGEKFAATTGSRMLRSTSYSSAAKTLTIEWGTAMSAKEVGVEITCYTSAGVKTVLHATSDDLNATMVLSDIDVTRGVSYRTKYLPEATAIDTFYTAAEKIPARERIVVSQGCATTTSDILAGYPGSLAVDGDKTTTPSRWVTDDTNNEHWLTLDLGQEYEINAFETWSGSPAQVNFSLQVEVDGQWVTVHNKTGNSALQYYGEFTPVKAQRVRYYIPAYQTNRVRLYEIVIYSVVEY